MYSIGGGKNAMAKKMTKKEAAAKKASLAAFRAACHTLRTADENSPEFKKADALVMKALSR
jgi:hypothetical protein